MFVRVVRYDLYKQIGSPEINELEDYVDVLKQMKEVCPTSDSGKETYGVSLFKDWVLALCHMFVRVVLCSAHPVEDAEECTAVLVVFHTSVIALCHRVRIEQPLLIQCIVEFQASLVMSALFQAVLKFSRIALQGLGRQYGNVCEGDCDELLWIR